ncbi:MAG TPA: rhomboid family intramembrane serine protease [Bosea sp. (in: a-proteobacteria)]|nr:rhomboid family intramembrane serine protease [Bosea sp. (in: a-proteobacteria)]
MFPWAAPVARRYPPIVVWTVVGISVLAFLYQVGLPPRVLDRFLFDFALVPSRFFGQRLITPSDWAPFLTNIFLHGGWLHVILNMWTLWIVGPAVEDRLGPARFALFYLFCGVAAGLAHALANPDSVMPALGASGAIDPPPLNWSTLKYVFWQTGGPICRRSATSLKRSSRSCARSMCWSRRGSPWPMRSARSG